MTKSRKSQERGKRGIKPELGEDLSVGFHCLLGLTYSIGSLVSKKPTPDKLNVHHQNPPFFRVFLSRLFKATFRQSICQIRHCVTNERLLAGHVRVKRREGTKKK